MKNQIYRNQRVTGYIVHFLKLKFTLGNDQNMVSRSWTCDSCVCLRIRVFQTNLKEFIEEIHRKHWVCFYAYLKINETFICCFFYDTNPHIEKKFMKTFWRILFPYFVLLRFRRSESRVRRSWTSDSSLNKTKRCSISSFFNHRSGVQDLDIIGRHQRLLCLFRTVTILVGKETLIDPHCTLYRFYKQKTNWFD